MWSAILEAPRFITTKNHFIYLLINIKIPFKFTTNNNNQNINNNIIYNNNFINNNKLTNDSEFKNLRAV